MMNLRCTSEWGRLREAVVHRPGHELVRMTPSTRDYFLFDDLLYDHNASQEHDWFTALLRDHLGIRLHYFDRLLAEALEAAPERERRALIAQVCRLEGGLPPVEQRVAQLEVLVRWYQGHGWPQYPQDPEGDPDADAPAVGQPGQQTAAPVPSSLAEALSRAGEAGTLAAQAPPAHDYLRARLDHYCAQGDYAGLARDLIEGIESTFAGTGNGPDTASGLHPDESDVLRHFAEGKLFHLTPLPNLMFLRDMGTVIGDRLLLGRMAAPARAREPLLFDFLLRRHPDLQGSPRWLWTDPHSHDHAWSASSSPRLLLEGGNLMQLREDLVLMAVSRRTTLDAVQRLADLWREESRSAGTRMLLYTLRLPAGVNHLDSIFGPISDTECVVYPPMFEPYGPASVDVVRVELGSGQVQPARSADFFASLRADGLEIEPVPCGGDDPAEQQREQWFSGANLLALAPGKVVLYRSAEKTAAELAKRGYRIVDIGELQRGAVKLSLDDPGKWAIRIKGSELSRGHGGPHSLVYPLVRGM